MVVVTFSDLSALQTFQELRALIAESLPWTGLPRCSSCGMCFCASSNCESVGTLHCEADAEAVTAGQVGLLGAGSLEQFPYGSREAAPAALSGGTAKHGPIRLNECADDN